MQVEAGDSEYHSWLSLVTKGQRCNATPDFLKTPALSLKTSAADVPRKKAFMLLASLENIPDSTVLTRARGTANRVALRVDRAGT